VVREKHKATEDTEFTEVPIGKNGLSKTLGGLCVLGGKMSWKMALSACVKLGWCTLAQRVALFQQKYFSAEKAREWPRIGD